MKASELRIGNWILYKGVEVQWLIEDYAEWGNNIELLIHPIPITKKHLERFGFEDKMELWQHQSHFDIQMNNNEFHIILSDIGAGVFITSIKYVHELQNAYYALTAKEL